MSASTSEKLLQMTGMIRRLDLVNRELELTGKVRRTTVDVPSDCLVRLRGETVKLRMLQPGDNIHVIFALRAGGNVAREIEVHCNQPFSPTSN